MPKRKEQVGQSIQLEIGQAKQKKSALLGEVT